MGERAAYRVSRNGKSMFMIRKQWYEGSTHEELRTLVTNVAQTLMKDKFGLNPNTDSILIGGGAVALRNDLGVGRLSMALLLTMSEPPFDEIVEGDNINCDINDHGIFEIELIAWDTWYLNHYPVEYGNEKNILGDKKHLATITFAKGKSLADGMNVEYHVPNDWEYPEEA